MLYTALYALKLKSSNLKTLLGKLQGVEHKINEAMIIFNHTFSFFIFYLLKQQIYNMSCNHLSYSNLYSNCGVKFLPQYQNLHILCKLKCLLIIIIYVRYFKFKYTKCLITWQRFLKRKFKNSLFITTQELFSTD